jgi:TATA-binding protein-associated factor
MALHSRYANIWQAAARCFATICNAMSSDAALFAIEKIIPFLRDAIVLSNRQDAAEAVYCMYLIVFNVLSLICCADIIQHLDIKVVPYVIFLIVPILGCMSDPDDDIWMKGM